MSFQAKSINTHFSLSVQILRLLDQWPLLTENFFFFGEVNSGCLTAFSFDEARMICIFLASSNRLENDLMIIVDDGRIRSRWEERIRQSNLPDSVILWTSHSILWRAMNDSRSISPSAEENYSAIHGRIIGKYDMRDYCWQDERWRKRSQSMLRTNNICQARRRKTQLTGRKLTSIVKKIIRRSVQFDLMSIIRWSEGNCITSNARSPLNRPTVISLSLYYLHVLECLCRSMIPLSRSF